MIDLQEDAGKTLLFSDAGRWLGALDANAAADLAMAAGDIALVMSPDGTIRDVAASANGFAALRGWIGRRWGDTVTSESKAKIEEMLGARGAALRWRQVNHIDDGDGETPVRYLAVRLDGSDRLIAIGRDVRASAVLQQRLLQVQQSLERDYLSLRQAESRYRLLFEMTAEPILIVEAASRRIREINPAAARLSGVSATTMAGQPLASLILEEGRDRLTSFLGAVAAGADPAPLAIPLAGSAGPVTVAASLFRQGGANYFLLQLSDEAGKAGAAANPLAEVIERMPDAFVLTDARLGISAANAAFAELVQAGSIDRLLGRPLADYLGRPGIDLNLIVGQLAEQGVVRNVATILRGLDGGREDVEVSGVKVGDAGGHYGFSLRGVGRRLRDLPPAERDLPRSVEQLTELVGRMPLKEIVRESTDLIERLCIEAALAYTSNNRASAAEILGLSRQSLYAKLHRHGLGNLGVEVS